MTGPADALVDQAARDRIVTDLDTTLFVEAGAGSGKTRSLVDRVVALIEHGVAMRHIAAITFTEKAATELRDRIRQRLQAAAQASDEAGAARFRAALEEVDAAAISTLHAFAQRILAEHPIEARLPPRFEVLDEVASEIRFEERWRRFRDAVLDDAELEPFLLLAFAADVRVEDLRALAAQLGGHWDRLGQPGRLPPAPEDPPVVDTAGFVAELDALLARRAECSDPDDTLHVYLDTEIAPYAELLRHAPDEYEALRLLRRDKPSFRAGRRGKGSNWEDKDSILDAVAQLGEAREALASGVATVCLQRLAVEIARFTLESAEGRRTDGRLEFHDLLVLARNLLHGEHGVAVRNRLCERYQRLLLDEFQDTDPIQIELATLIASSDPTAPERPWHDVDVDAGRLFFVGDPKQSIYRFRRADIALYLEARDRHPERVSLTTNFRSTPPVITWVNHVFGQLIAGTEGSQPDYEPIDPAPRRTIPPVGAPVAVLGREPHEARLSAEQLREAEAADVAAAVQTALGWQVSERGADGEDVWRPARLADIAVLLPARTSLRSLERALVARGIPYRAETSSLVYTTREIRDLLLAARAVVDPTDQLALVAALRSPLFGCGDDDLVTYRVVHGGRWDLHAPPPATLEQDHPVVAALGYLGSLHDALVWQSPAELLDRLARDRRLFELGYADGRPRDLWRRLRFVIDQARAWSEAEGGTCRDYLDWARLQASESARVVETVLPETDDDSVRILTIHGSKGLEFPVTVLSGMTNASRGATSRVEVAFPDDGPVAVKVGKGLVTPEFAAHQPIDEQMGFDERLRLLYVACTRAQDHLVVSLHRNARKQAPDHDRKYTNAELIARACDDLDLPELGGEPPPVAEAAEAPDLEPLLSLEEWDRERSEALTRSSERRSVGASDVELLAGTADAETVAGGTKQPRDLALAAWQKGRYGTAVGRAVHAVLQTIDLATGEPLEQTVAAQAAAEGVIGREADIAGLVRSALDAPAVRESLQWPRWRETYVATAVGDRTLEGYVDLLYRTDRGLVIVDYKTASQAANLEERVGTYRAQGAAYAVAVAGATGESVDRVVFLFLTGDGPVELDLPDLAGATAELEAVLGAGVPARQAGQ